MLVALSHEHIALAGRLGSGPALGPAYPPKPRLQPRLHSRLRLAIADERQDLCQESAFNPS